ncbi:MAG: formate dehydrogenase accessory protein FdhE, partial [Planctomycetes bacterium]|nr:formate dehydrogenase accessory protein FdhE [Planctomycetota bacterium]
MGASTEWIVAHPYLEPLARLHGSLAAAPRGALRRGEGRGTSADEGDAPLLQRPASAAWLAAASDHLGDLLAQVSQDSSLPANVVEACRKLAGELGLPGERVRALQWLTTGADPAPVTAHGWLLGILGWAALRQVVGAVVHDGAWGRRQCPTCGALPAMAQIVAEATSSRRLLACGLCGTRWSYRRIGCPFCGTEAAEHLGILAVDDDERLRIDVCRQCKGYLKTYAGEGDEELFLSDWPTMHLDVLAHEQGFVRAGSSLY